MANRGRMCDLVRSAVSGRGRTPRRRNQILERPDLQLHRAARKGQMTAGWVESRSHEAHPSTIPPAPRRPIRHRRARGRRAARGHSPSCRRPNRRYRPFAVQPRPRKAGIVTSPPALNRSPALRRSSTPASGLVRGKRRLPSGEMASDRTALPSLLKSSCSSPVSTSCARDDRRRRLKRCCKSRLGRLASTRPN